MSHSICFPPRKVTAKVYVTKMASQKKVPQITTTNKNNKNTTDLRFQTLSSASLWCARILFVNERENAARLLLCCVATFGNILNSIFCGHPNFRFFLFFFCIRKVAKRSKSLFRQKKYLHKSMYGTKLCPLEKPTSLLFPRFYRLSIFKSEETLLGGVRGRLFFDMAPRRSLFSRPPGTKTVRREPSCEKKYFRIVAFCCIH